MDENTFEIGLCMAGAVSAGAYTAGVMDYLIEALDDWEQRRGQAGVPTHKVVIKLIGGASAGGMTGILTASSINNPIKHMKELSGDIMQPHPENRFYNTWVDLLEDDMFSLMLDPSDIKQAHIYSLLNSSFIDKVAERVVKADPDNWIERPYFDNRMKFFSTLTNVRGYNYDSRFNGVEGAANSYWLSYHTDYATFQLNTLEYEGKGWIPVSCKNGLNTEILKNAAMSTGAFPIGLRARKLERPAQYVNDMAWLKPITKDFPVEDDPHVTLNVDGGVINNEPFVKVRELLGRDSSDHAGFKSTVLMIDPFPSYKKGAFKVEEDSMKDVMFKTVSTMLNQVRFKQDLLNPDQVKIDYDNYSQFLIAPKRGGIHGEKALACGFLDGFGGFIHKEFRIHDFFLGRANCQKFLRDHFTVPSDTPNGIFKRGYEGINDDDFTSRSQKGKRQIIPIFEELGGRMYMPTFKHGQDWPLRKKEEIDVYKAKLKKRAGSLIMNMAQYSTAQRLFIGIGNRVVLRRLLGNKAFAFIKKSLEKHHLIKS